MSYPFDITKPQTTHSPEVEAILESIKTTSTTTTTKA